TKLHIRSTLAYFALGEELIMLTVWPVFIAITFVSYEKMGGAVAAATFITAIFTLYIGKLIDHNRPKKTLRIGAMVSALVWISRPWLSKIGLVFASDTVGRIAKNTTYVTLTTASYGKAVLEKQVIERS